MGSPYMRRLYGDGRFSANLLQSETENISMMPKSYIIYAYAFPARYNGDKSPFKYFLYKNYTKSEGFPTCLHPVCYTCPQRIQLTGLFSLRVARLIFFILRHLSKYCGKWYIVSSKLSKHFNFILSVLRQLTYQIAEDTGKFGKPTNPYWQYLISFVSLFIFSATRGVMKC